jgi:uncharacterized protein (TIGR00369 family)
MPDDAPMKTLTISYDDPAELAQRCFEMPGLEFLRAIRDGALPPAPIQELLGFPLVEADEGHVAFTAIPGEQHFNPIGVVHAGLAATMLDSAMGAAVHTTLPIGSVYTTLETKFNLVRAVKLQTGEIRCDGQVVHRGRRMATAEGRVVRTSDGKLVAHGTSTCLIMSAEDG